MEVSGQISGPSYGPTVKRW